MARGYGLSLGLLAGALWHLSEYTALEKKQKHLLLSLLFAGLSMWASFVTLHAFLGITFVLFCLTVFDAQLRTKEKLKRAGFAFVLFAAFFAVAFPVMLKMQKADAFYWGQNELWSGTLCGLGGLLSYTVNGDVHLHQHAEDWLVALILSLSLALLTFALIRNRRQPFLQSETKVISVLLLTGFIIILAQHFILGSPYPAGRTSLWMFVIFLWAVCSAVRVAGVPGKMRHGLLGAAVAFQLFFAIPDFNLQYTEEWQYCANVDGALELLTTRIHSGAEPNAALTVAADAEYGNIAAYYSEQMNLRNIAFFGCSPADDPQADYYLITPHAQHLIPFTDTVMVYRESKLVLLRNRTLSAFRRSSVIPLATSEEVRTINEPGTRVVLYEGTFSGADTMNVRLCLEAFISFPHTTSAGVFTFWLDRADTLFWASYSVCDPRADSMAGVYRVGRQLPVQFVPGDIFKINFEPFEDPGGPIEISRFHAFLQVRE